MLKQASSILRVLQNAQNPLGIGTGLASWPFKTTDFFAVNPFMRMFIICELRTENLRTTKMRTKMRTRSLGSHVIRTVRILVLKIDILRPAPCELPGGRGNILHVFKCR